MHDQPPRDTLRLRARLDRRRVRASRDTFAHLVIDITAPEADADRPLPELPLNLGLVIDASGSMEEQAGGSMGPRAREHGRTRLEAAKRAACGVVGQLEDRDVLTVVSFSDEAITHVAATPLGRGGRTRCLDAIDELGTRGCTDLNGGWLKGAEHVAGYAQEQRRNRVLLLSDGYANQGVTDPEELAHTARGLRERGIYTSTVGIGLDYSTDQLEVLAEHGGGTLHHALEAEDIVAVILAELRDMHATALDDVEVVLSLAEAASCRTGVTVLGYPADEHDGIVTASMGSMVGGTSRSVVFRLDLPASTERVDIPLALSIAWRDDEGIARTSPTQQVAFTLDPHTGDAIDPDIAVIAAEKWLDVTVRRALERHRDGDREVLAWLDRELRSYKWYCRHVSGGEKLVRQLRKVRDRLARPMRESTRKEIMMSRHKSLRGTADYRVAEAPMAWESYLDEE